MSSGCGSEGGTGGGRTVSTSAAGMVRGVLVSVSSTFGSSTTAILFLSLGSCQSIIMDEMRGPYHEIVKLRTSFRTSDYSEWTLLEVRTSYPISSGKVSPIIRRTRSADFRREPAVTDAILRRRKRRP